MGSTYDFECTYCGYTVSASGEDDAGFLVYTWSRICRKCVVVVDVLAGPTVPSALTDDERKRMERNAGRCPHCRGRDDLVPWGAPHPCPRCGVPMCRSGGGIMWD